MLNRYQRLIVLVIVCAPIIAMVVLGTAHVVHQVRILLTDARWILSDVLSRQFDRQVRVGHARLAPLGIAVVERVEMADGPTFASGKLISIPKLTVRYDFFRVAFGGAGAGGVDSVEVVEPRVWIVRSSTGVLNIADLIKRKPGPPGPPFKGTLRVVGGHVQFTDHATTQYAGHPEPVEGPAVLRLRDVDISFDATRHPDMLFRLLAAGQPGRVRSARITGTFNADTRMLRADASISGADAPLFAGIARATKKLDLRRGTVNASIGVATRLPLKAAPPATGFIRITDGALRPPGMASPITNVTGTVLLAGQRATVDLQGALAGSRARVVGTVTDFRKPEIDLSVSSAAVDLRRVMRTLGLAAAPRGVRIEGLRSLRARIGGTAARPEAEAGASVGAATAYGYTIRDLNFSAAYRDGVVTLGSLTFTINGAPSEARGTVELKGKRNILIWGAIRNFPLGSIPFDRLGASFDKLRMTGGGLSATGAMDAGFTVSGPAASPAVNLSAQVRNGIFQGVRFSGASAELSLDVRNRSGSGRIALNAAGGLIRIRGDVTRGKLNLAYAVEAVDISDLATLLKREDIGGIAYSGGRVFGAIANPTVTAALEVFNGRYGEYQSEYSRAAFSANRRRLSVKEGIVRMFPAELRFAGSATGLQTARIEFQGEAHVKRLGMDRLLDIVGREIDVTGTLAGDFTFSAAYVPERRGAGPRPLPFADAVANGTLRLEDGIAFGFVINSAGAAVALDDGKLAISDMTVVSGDAKAGLSGTVDLEAKTVDLAFETTGFDLARVRDRLENHATVTGIANASGSIKGRYDAITVEAVASIDQLIVDGVSFDQATLDVAYSNNLLSSFRLALARGEQLLEFSGTDFDLKTRCMTSGSGRIVKVSVPDVWAMVITSPYLRSEEAAPLRNALRTVPRLASGVIDGVFELSGCLNKPDGSANIVARDVGIDSRRIDLITADVAWAGGAVMLRDARAVSEDTSLVLAPGTPGEPVYRDGKLNLVLTANNLDLIRLRQWLGDYTPSGIATADFTITGEWRTPDIRGSVEVVNPGIGFAKFDSLRISQIRVGRQSISVSDVILSIDSHQIVGAGRLPWAWDTLTVPRDRSLEFSASLVNEDLSILHTFASQILPAPRTSGALEAEVNLAGTIAEPKLSGAVRVNNGALAIAGFKSAFTNVNIDIGFDGKNIVFNDLSVESSSGGMVGLVPGGTVEVGGKEYGAPSLVIQAKGLILEEEGALGLQEKLKTQVDAGIAIAGSVYRPVISDADAPGLHAGILVSNTIFQFAIPEEKPTAQIGVLPIHPFFFDLHVDLGENVRVRPPLMELLVTGGGIASGEIGKDFNVGFDFEVKEGRIALAVTRLRVVPGARMTVRFQPPNPPEIRLAGFEATTTVVAATPIGTRERYKITISASGPVGENLNIDYKSDPPGLSREQILATLGHVEGLLGTAESAFQKEFTTALRAVGTTALFMPVQQLFIERFGFEEFAIESGPFTPLSLYASRRLFGSFYVSFYQRLTATAGLQDQQYLFTFGYRFRDFYSVSTSIDDQQTLSGQLLFTRAFH